MKSTTKKAIENIKKYIIDNYNNDNYNIDIDVNDFKQVARSIYDVFNDEYINEYNKRFNEFDNFTSYCQGLPSIIDTCYYYNRSAKNDLIQILEETPEQANKYSEQQAEKNLTWLLYRTIKNEVNKKCNN